jgi:hypothetical protein
MLARPVGKDHSRKLRACDLVTLHVDEVCSGAKVRDPATVLQKNGRPVQFETTKRKASLEVTNAPDDWLSISFPEPTNWEIGGIQRISEKTVEFHLRNTIKKVGASNRITIGPWTQNGLITL